jgi:hypothetical protein|eukprot:31504-Pelagococcus_subviridis.AAC.17
MTASASRIAICSSSTGSVGHASAVAGAASPSGGVARGRVATTPRTRRDAPSGDEDVDVVVRATQTADDDDDDDDDALATRPRRALLALLAAARRGADAADAKTPGAIIAPATLASAGIEAINPETSRGAADDGRGCLQLRGS